MINRHGIQQKNKNIKKTEYTIIFKILFVELKNCIINILNTDILILYKCPNKYMIFIRYVIKKKFTNKFKKLSCVIFNQYFNIL